jgi:hypothetical protein
MDTPAIHGRQSGTFSEAITRSAQQIRGLTRSDPWVRINFLESSFAVPDYFFERELKNHKGHEAQYRSMRISHDVRRQIQMIMDRNRLRIRSCGRDYIAIRKAIIRRVSCVRRRLQFCF